MFDSLGINYNRIDGAISLALRSEALRSFERDETTRVILVSITSGGTGQVNFDSKTSQSADVPT